MTGVAQGIRCSIPMRICGVVLVLAVLGIEGMAEADIVIYLKKGNKAVPVKAKKYFEDSRGFHVYPQFGAPMFVPKDRLCAIVDRRSNYGRVINRCTFTPTQLAEIQRLTERQRRTSKAISKMMKEEREAENERNRRKEEAEARARREAEEATLRLRAYTSLWIQVYSSSEKGLVWTHPPGDYLFSSVTACRRRGEALARQVVYFAPRTYLVYDVNCLPGDAIPRPFVLNEDLGWK